MDAWTQLLDVQALDTALTQLDHRRRQLPERAELEAIEEQLASLRGSRTAVEAERHELARAQQRIEDEIAIIQEKVAHAESQLYAGGSDVKHLQALQEEIAGFGRRVSVLEDQELELMEQMEPLDARIAELDSEQSSLDQRAVELTKSLAETEATLDAEEDDLRRQRATRVADIDESALSDYDRARGRLGGVAVARLDAGVAVPAT